MRRLQAAVGLTIFLGCGVAAAGGGPKRAARATTPAARGTPAFQALGVEYSREILPVLRRYCTGCHSTAKRAGELDLERFGTLAAVRRDPKAWMRVAEIMHDGEMPPRGARQPTPAQRQRLTGWVERYLDAEALANAGDPGPVVLRRLNNAEYTYTIRELTGIDLDPARDFPADGAAGEGFTNTGGSLVMSPALLTKYFDAGKEIARHAQLLPEGFRFAPSTSRSDWTNEALDRIRALYQRYTDAGQGTSVNLQGIVIQTNEGGRLPVERYLAALLEEREALRSGKKSLAAIAAERSLSAKYLVLLWNALHDRKPSLLLDDLRARWSAARPGDASSLTAAIADWQRALWRFTTVGHIGRAGGPTRWQEPVTPLVERREVRYKVPASPDGSPVTLYLTARDAGDGSAEDYAVWGQPRLVAPGRPDLPLRDVRALTGELLARRKQLFAATAKALAAANAATREESETAVAQLAERFGVRTAELNPWLETLGIGVNAPLNLTYFRTKLTSGGGHPFINGWGSPDLPSLLTNASDQAVRIPGHAKPHGVFVHPTPTLSACVGWRSPLRGAVRIDGKVTHAHPECGNGVTWSLELRRGGMRRRLAAGTAHAAQAAPFTVTEPVAIRPGDLLSLVIGPRDRNHSCDLTDLEFRIRSAEGEPKASEWSLTRDVADNVLDGNPHADRLGNAGVWHFYSEPVDGAEPVSSIPAGSLLARWQSAQTTAERLPLAAALQKLLVEGPPPGQNPESPDVALYRQLRAFTGPLLSSVWREFAAKPVTARPSLEGVGVLGLDPSLFGKHPAGKTVDPASLCVRAPSVLEVRLPAELAAGAELATTASLHPEAGMDASVQMEVRSARDGLGSLLPGTPVVVRAGSPAGKRFETAFADFRALFPAALCYPKIVPTDEVVTLTLFYREDEPLRRLMLTDAEARDLDRLWAELRWVSQAPLKLVNAYEQIVEFATQDRPDLVEAFKLLKQPVYAGADAFRKELVAAEPRQLDHLTRFAARAYRRPLTPAETTELRGLYARLRAEELPHDEAFRLTLARIFTAPAFLYRLETAPAGPGPAPVSDWELATRLSYFLWSSPPDERLRAVAASGTLRKPEVLTAQTRRMLKDPRARRLATEFACQWLQIYEFDALDEKSERHFPEFAVLRQDMYEEAIRFFTDLFQRDGSVLSLFDADHTFVNGRLARFYGLPGLSGLKADTWQRVEGMRSRGRGGVLGLAATLAKQSGASRTSPILRGNWVSEVLLGERLPRPPKNVPPLPEDETATEGLTMRQLVVRHTSDPKCSGCHVRIDPFGFSLEGFDAIGRSRKTDLGNRPVDTRAETPDGQQIDGLDGLRTYLVQKRRDTVLRQFCRKLLGYSLGRAVQLSDQPLLEAMERKLAKQGYRFSVAVDLIVQSRQFQYKR